jgi:hypothetical protein
MTTLTAKRTTKKAAAQSSHQLHPWPALDERSTTRRFAITEESLTARRKFIRLAPEDQTLLTEFLPWAHSVAPSIAREFYDWQFDFPPTRQFFDRFAKERGMPLAQLRQHLEAAQAGYVVEIFAGASINWDLRYFEKRLNVGVVHDRINLPFKWYIGSYSEYRRLFDIYLHRDFTDHEKIRRVESALERVFNLDLQAIGDAFLMSTLEQMLNSAGIHLDNICTSADRTDQAGTTKTAINAQLSKFLNSVKQMAVEHDQGEIDFHLDPAEFLGNFKTIAQDVNGLVDGHITVKKKAMACIAEFGKGNMIMLDGSTGGMEQTMRQMMALWNFRASLDMPGNPSTGTEVQSSKA